MRTCDVLIVGGGPGGSACAAALHRAGLDVLVMDKARFPRDKTCAGWITPAVVAALDLDLADYAAGRVLQSITGFRVGTIDGRDVETRYGRVVSYGIRRCEFDDYLLRRSGARLCLGEAVRQIERRNGGWCINAEIETPLLVGAGGHFCPVARFLGADPPAAPVVAAQEVEFELDARQRGACAVQADVPELYFCRDLAGYAWCFRKGDYLNLGIGREDARRLSEHTRAFVDRLKRCGRIPADAPERYRGHAYILYGHTRREPIGSGVLLVGDAAGLADARSGEGIRTAVESGLLAAEAIVAAGGDYSAAHLAPYAAALRTRFGPPRTDGGWLRFVPAGLKRALAARLFASRWFARRVVLDRWFLGAGVRSVRSALRSA